MGRALMRHDALTIALPHNVEALVPGSSSPWTRRRSPEWLEEEVWALSAANTVFAISSCDQHILSLWGISAELLPYAPAPSLRAHLDEVRANRASPNDQDVVLLMGTASNYPTLQGMREALRYLPGIVARARPGALVIVAGAGTELIELPPATNVHVLGRVSERVLDHLMRRALAAVVHQPATSGSLTRIPELLIAGVPVLANVNASRCRGPERGIVTYRDWAEFEALLAGGSFGLPEQERETSAVDDQRFLSIVRAL
jgi:hypothetical protein